MQSRNAAASAHSIEVFRCTRSDAKAHRRSSDLVRRASPATRVGQSLARGTGHAGINRPPATAGPRAPSPLLPRKIKMQTGLAGPWGCPYYY